MKRKAYERNRGFMPGLQKKPIKKTMRKEIMGKIKNLLIDWEEQNGYIPTALPWEMGGNLCKRCDTDSTYVIRDKRNTMIVPCSYCDRPMEINGDEK
tara:strand:- start:272 stop:562 length:291 start_codon:yes stop_codon:yes gene_type:complete